LGLAKFACETETSFLEELENQTNRLVKCFPVGARHWGTARKALNLYLGESYYNRIICEEYGFDRIVQFLYWVATYWTAAPAGLTNPAAFGADVSIRREQGSVYHVATQYKIFEKV
jgi:hypothetical protein